MKCKKCEGKGFWWPPYVGGDDDGPEVCPDCQSNEEAKKFVEQYQKEFINSRRR
jgi:hypothetical protein